MFTFVVKIRQLLLTENFKSHPGQTHFDIENPREPSRWNTLRALQVLNHFGMDG